MPPQVLILRTAGTNCDTELAHAFALAGAQPTTLHLSELIATPRTLNDFDILGFPGGFSYGDDIAAGRIFASRLHHHLDEPLRQAVRRGVPMIGICNGFQVLVKLGLLPDPEVKTQTTTLADNDAGRFIDRWTDVAVPDNTRCIWTQNLHDHELPIAHGEGRFVAPDPVLDQLEAQGQIALKYCDNPNGSQRNIAGICDPTGLIFGLMPHPERFTTATQHPAWTRQPPSFLGETTAGLRYFQNAVDHVKQHQPAGVA